MKMQKRQFRIGQLAQQLGVEKFVIRFWEKEFGVATIRSVGGQRFYNQEDLEQFSTIKHLLYDKGFTIAGARQQLSNQLSKSKTTKTTNETKILGSHKTTLELPETTVDEITNKIVELKKSLMKLQELL